MTTVIVAHPDSPLGKARARRDELAPKVVAAENRVAELRAQLVETEAIINNVTALSEPKTLAEAMTLRAAINLIVAKAERDHRELKSAFENASHKVGEYEHNAKNFDIGLANVAEHWRGTDAHRYLKMQRLALSEPMPPGGWHIGLVDVE